MSSLKEGLNKFPVTCKAQSDSERAVPGHQKKVAARAVDIASSIVPCRMCLTPVSRLQPFDQACREIAAAHVVQGHQSLQGSSLPDSVVAALGSRHWCDCSFAKI
jgi:hypothetical protein